MYSVWKEGVVMNIQKAIDRLLFLQDSMGEKVTYGGLHTILSALQEPEDDKKIKIGGYQELAVRIENANQRIGDIESKCLVKLIDCNNKINKESGLD